MRIPGNKLRHLRDFFYTELSGTYDEGEITALFKLAAEKFLGWNAAQQNLNLDENLNQSDLLKLYDCAKDLAKHIPLQYILKEAWFYNLPFYVDDAVLIPRPETEELVDLIIRENKETGTIFDIGTGSGCIPVTLKKNRPSLQVTACDISVQALEVAKKNARSHLTEIRFLHLDILDTGSVHKSIKDQFDIIVSNPPYIKRSEATDMHANVLSHEPEIALFAPEQDEIIFYRQIILLCKDLLKTNGRVYLELNPLTAESVKELTMQTGIFSEAVIRLDMSGKKRFLVGVRI